jgi:tRNA-specific 2-thiouridylase
MRLRDVNWIGGGGIENLPGADREIFVKVRSTRAPQRGLLRADETGLEVELLDGEEGVSPGQACVFYDSAEGQSRVLGGGFITREAATRPEMLRAPELAR